MRKAIIISVLALIAASSTVNAQSQYFKPVRFTINSEDGRYAKGDTVKIFANLVEPCEMPLEMKIYENAGPRHYASFKKKVETRPVSLSEQPTLVYSGVFNEPHTAMLSIAPADKSVKERAMVGFGVAIDEIRPGFDIPNDFTAYWDDQKKALRKSKMQIKREPVESKSATADVWAIELSMPEGNPVRGYMAMPKGAAKKSLPIILIVHSAGVDRPGCASSITAVEKASQCGNGAIAIDINAHGMLNGQPKEYYKDLVQGELKGYQSRPLTTRDEFYFRLMYLREVRTMDFACKLPEWDGRRAVVYGGSQGGGQSLAIAGLDSRITLCCAGVPAMTDYGGAIFDRQSGWPSGYGKDAITELGRDILPYFDGALFAQFTKAKIIFHAGFIDETCYAGCVIAAYNACPSEDKKLFTSPFRWHSGTAKPYMSYHKYDDYRSNLLNEYCK